MERSLYLYCSNHKIRGPFLSEELNIIIGKSIELHLEDMHDFQGEFKYLEEQDLEKLISRIKDVGFCDSFSVWKNEGKYYLLNGHQRKLALIKMKADGVKIPKLPAIVIEAESIEHAKRCLMSIESKYGTLNKEVAKTWFDELEDGIGNTLKFVGKEIDLSLDFDIDVGGPEEENENTSTTKSTTICPSCQYEWMEQ
jgi:hypothetical protein